MRAIGTRYKLGPILGQGGMATVYQAEDTQLKRKVALKIIRPDLINQTDVVDRFLHEARMAAGFAHAHIARVYDVGTDEQYGPFFVQELIEGQSLETLLPAPTLLTFKWLEHISTALITIHQQGLVHCDIKPQNIRITPQEKAVLIDFGVAQSSGDSTGAVVYGTPHYMAPERAQGVAATPTSDVYALGVLLYEMLSGKVPLDGATPVEVIQRHIHEGIPSLRQDVPGQAQAIEQLIFKATERDPQQRFQSVQDFLDDLTIIQQQAINPTVAMPVALPRATVSIHNQATEMVPVVPKPQPVTDAANLPPPPAALLAEDRAAAQAKVGYAPVPAVAPVTPAQAVKPKATLPWQLMAGTLGIAVLLILFMAFKPSDTNLVTTDQTITTPVVEAAPSEIAAPQLIGVNIVDAELIADQQGWTIEVAERLFSTAPLDSIISQQPDPDTILDADAVVLVRVSLGPENAQQDSVPALEQPPGPDDSAKDDKKGKDDDKGKGKGKDKDK